MYEYSTIFVHFLKKENLVTVMYLILPLKNYTLFLNLFLNFFDEQYFKYHLSVNFQNPLTGHCNDFG